MDGSKELKILIAIPSPRDYAQVKAAVDILPADKLWIKYYKPEIDAYDVMREEFLNSDYTHLVIIPDDLVVSLETYIEFVKDVQQFPWDIVTGYCNLDRTYNSGYTNISPKLVPDKREGRTYTWFTLSGFKEEAHQYRIENPEKHFILPEYMIDVPFAGFPLFSIPRQIVEEVRFRNDMGDGHHPEGCCIDVTFCWDAIKAGHRILCDTRLKTIHLKVNDWNVEEFYAGVKPRQLIYDRLVNAIKL